MLCIQKSAFIYSVGKICHLDSMETDAIQIHGSVIVHGSRVFISMIRVFKYNKSKNLPLFLPRVLYIILSGSALAIITTK